MQTRTKVGGAVGGLAALTALVAAVIAFIVFVMVALAALVAVASAIVAYIKRDTWTKPAYKWTRDKSGQVVTPTYRWVRDKSGRWKRTPWAARDGNDPEMAAAEERAD